MNQTNLGPPNSNEHSRLLKTVVDQWALLSRSMELVWKAAPGHTTILAAAMVLQGVLPTVIAWFSKMLLDGAAGYLSGTLPLSAVLATFALLTVSTVLSALAGQIALFSQAQLVDLVTSRLTLSLMDEVGSLTDLGPFEDPKYYDDLQIIQRQSGLAPMMLITNLIGVGRALVTAVSMLAMAVRFHPLIPLGLVLFAIPPAISLLRVQRSTHFTLTGSSPESRKMGYFSSVVLSETHAKEVRVFDLVGLFKGRYRRAFDGFYQAMTIPRKEQLRSGILSTGLNAVGTGMLLWLTLRGILEARLTAGDLLLFMTTGTQAQSSLTTVITLSAQVYSSLLYMKSVFGFLDGCRLRVRRSTPDAAMSAWRFDQKIEFQGITFQYPGGPHVLNGISFSIRRGETVALVGENGAGKTTLVKLLLRLHEPQRGRILVDGVDLQKIDVSAWRQRVSVVFQDHARYHMPARDNIGVGWVPAMNDMDRVANAARSAGIDDTIETLPQKYDTMLGRMFHGGVDLSGGEWQKVAIARAFMRDADLLILDEPTSALDAESEQNIIDSLLQLTKGKTAIVISHRFSTARVADRILVLEGGTITESGSHSELMRINGRYAQLHRIQSARYVEA